MKSTSGISQEGTMTAQTDTATKPRRSRKAAATPEVTVPTVTDEQYQELLKIRLSAMKGFESGTVDEKTKNAARAAIRNARKIRKAEEASGVLPAYREYQAKQAEEAAKAEAAKERKPRVRKSAAEIEQVPGSPLTEVPAPEIVVTETEDGGVQVEIVPDANAA